MTPILFIDLETTGFSPAEAAPLSICVHVLGGPDNGAEFHAYMRPFNGAVVSPMALQVNGFTREQIQEFPDPIESYEKFRDFIRLIDAGAAMAQGGEALPHHVLGGWNLKFDESFMRAWINRHGDPSWYGNTFDSELCEVSYHYKALYPDYKQRFGGYKLVQAYHGIFGRPLSEAHTAAADVLATRDIFLHCDKQLSEPQYKDHHHLLSYA